jgi:hypothetical protein
MAFFGIGAVPYDLEPKDTGPDRGIMPAVSQGIYDITGAHLYRLPASRQEVIGAEQSLNHPDLSVLLLDANATESKFKSQCQHRDKRAPESSVRGDPGVGSLIGGDAGENSI